MEILIFIGTMFLISESFNFLADRIDDYNLQKITLRFKISLFFETIAILTLIAMLLGMAWGVLAIIINIIY